MDFKGNVFHIVSTGARVDRSNENNLRNAADALHTPIEILANLIYLIKLEPGNRAKIVDYVKVAEIAFQRLIKAAKNLETADSNDLN
jgi:hypothetical protein